MSSLPLSLYIHLPWCVKKCPYCDFNSHLKPVNIPEDEYFKALLEDLDHDLNLISDLKNKNLISIFFGGGTPSLFSSKFITNLLENINKKISFAPNIEITLEANPNSTEYKKFKDFNTAGINRISLGAQSFQDEKLKILGRAHDTNDIYNAINAIISSNITNFNIDLMHGLPNQSLDDALFDLSQAIEFNPPHLSWYQLTLEPNTVFAKFPPKLPDEKILDAIFKAGKNLLEQNNYINYEVSAFGKENHFCRHNLNYWQYGDYLGIGAGAHSKITSNSKTIRLDKHKNPTKYLSSSNYINSQNIISDPERIFEFMLNNLRLTDGFDINNFKLYTNIDFNLIEDKINKLINKNLLIKNNNKIYTSNLGRKFLDDVIQEFLPN